MRFGLVAGATTLLVIVLLLWVLEGGRERREGPSLPPKLITPFTSASPAELVQPALAQPVGSFSSSEAELPLVASAVGRGARESRPPASVRLFQHALHSQQLEQGLVWPLDLGANESGRAFDDDQASAIEIPDGLQATLFEDSGMNGHCLSLGSGRHNLASYGFNDRISSVRVARAGQDPGVDGPVDAVELFEHRAAERGERGKVWRLSLPERMDERLFSASLKDFEARAVSTVWVPPRHELTLFLEPDGRGLAVVLGPGLHELDYLAFNDRTSSARLRRTR
jgi:hypothetical protein